MHGTQNVRGEHRLEQQRTRRMRLHALDVWVRDAAVLVDADQVREALYAGADAGGAIVVGEEFCVFPGGAVTGVLVLAQSHLSIHTWPEFGLANIDLLSYGDVRGEHALDVISHRLGAVRSRVTCIVRGVG